MILLHRFTPLLQFFLILGAFLTLWHFSPAIFTIGDRSITLHPALGSGTLLLAALYLQARLLLWDYRRPGFWVFFMTPLFFVLAAMCCFVILESPTAYWTVAFLAAGGFALYAENLFAFYHYPVSYQAYALEYLTMALYTLSFFFFTSAAFIGQIFLDIPMYVPALLLFFAIAGGISAVFWVGKVSYDVAVPYAVIGGVLFSELYIVLSMLPTNYVTNATIFVVALTTYVSLIRAHVLKKLTEKVAARHALFFFILSVLVLVTAPWR